MIVDSRKIGVEILEIMECDSCKYNIYAILKNGELLPYCERKNQKLRRQNNCPVYKERRS